MEYKKAGLENTENTVNRALDYAIEHKIETVVVASTKGSTGNLAAKMGKTRGVRVIVVTHNTGFSEPGLQELDDQYRLEIERNGAQIHTGTLVLRGAGSAIRKKFGSSEEEMIASVLRLFGQGMKVCVEMAAMVSDAGLIPLQDIVCIAGTRRGADTAALIYPAPSNQLFNIKVREIIVKPQDF